jgi:Phosphotransferase enzyme family
VTAEYVLGDEPTLSFSEALSQAIVEVSAGPNYAVEFAILATRDPRSIAEAFTGAIEGALRTSPKEVLFYKVSSGIVIACTLADGRSVVLKAHQGDRTAAGLTSQRLVQEAARQAGIDAPEPLLGPHTFGCGQVTFDSYIAAGVPVNTVPLPAEAPAEWTTLRRLLAEQLIAIARLPAPVDPNHGLTRISRLASDSLYPVPHSPLFDFSATAPGAEWIDAIAATALDTIRAIEATESLPMITTHCDLRAENVQVNVDGFSLAAIWDWDSIETASEAWHVGTSARAFSLDFSRDNGTCTDIGIPTVDEMLAFIADCQTARDRTYSPSEYRATVAWMHHALAYSARCEHALLGAGIAVRWTPTFADRLRELQAAQPLG